MTDLVDENIELKDTIEVQVKTRYLREQSRPEQSRYVYAYTITISNKGNTSAQLISRHWIITDEKDQTKEIKGPGVIGEQPIIKPGLSHTYSSGVVMETAVGTMAGSYQMQTLDGDTFEAVVPTFTLIQPSKLH
ncbi:Co2+/Mg2+ efflux protein ApaG [Marinagarivorans cellulosilyticus]|uniref:Protein ApaG n=1 Tax=Marinagarivorans cellulosilyticus TaxID=2721545 RepID=A0AAN2BLQ3_9GAMM|nr:Co2+/Mg2+ efflux protein ApaG [Marinagarivorans cellulosilyticus]BCD99271.1 ApaG protein [Marinagarivorans cellulosilyticus]